MDAIKELSELTRNGKELTGVLTGCTAYGKSVHEKDGTLCFLARSQSERFLVAAGSVVKAGFSGEPITISGIAALKCALSPQNAAALMALFPFTAPRSHRDAAFTMGLGDRLGLASPGHLQTIGGRGVFPVLAQQSIRELKLTGRTYEEVLAAAAFAVFQEGWQGGYGADGDHLKTAEEIRYALGCGYTMITLDCSEQIGRGTINMNAAAVEAAYIALPQELRAYFEKKYADKVFKLEGAEIKINTIALKEIVLTYSRAIDHAKEMYSGIIAGNPRAVDFEMSIDETTTPTTPEAHFVVAQELVDGGVAISSLAPRFCGEFQKGIDYIGNPADFERDFIVHEQIARHFGYKLSIHSGSDKFAVFGIIGARTGLRVHVKTAGTSWLEAVRVIAAKDPALFRELLAFAIEHLQEARAYYHISGDEAKVQPMAEVPDSKLGEYLNLTDSRQILHITYGLMLQAKNADGTLRFRQRIYSVLHKYEDEYAAALRKHIGRHVDTLEGI